LCALLLFNSYRVENQKPFCASLNYDEFLAGLSWKRG
jgi:hypothetical protein